MDPLTLVLIGIGIWIFVDAMQSGSGAQQPGGPPTDSGVPMSPIMPPTGKLSIGEIAQLAANAGFEGNDIVTATAIALAESGGDPGITGDQAITPGGSVGLWQINLYHHPEYNATELLDPQTNANAAYAIYRAAGSFMPWTTFKHGQYMGFLNQVTTYLNA